MFDDARLDDPQTLERSDAVLRSLAESGARVRREAVSTEEARRLASETLGTVPPRAIVAAGPDSRLLRAVLEPWCPVPFVAWPSANLPGWAGGLDLAVVLAPDGDDVDAARAVAESVRRACPLVVACPPDSLVASHAEGRYSHVLPTATHDQLAIAVSLLTLLNSMGLAPDTDAERVADALDAVAVSCGPFRDLTVNPAKTLASNIADTTALFWGGTVLAARAGRRIAESVRQATGRAALAGGVEQLLPVLEAAPAVDIFADPYADGDLAPRTALVILEDGFEDPLIARARERLVMAAQRRGVRVETISFPAEDEVARYAAMLLVGTYAAAYIRVGA